MPVFFHHKRTSFSFTNPQFIGEWVESIFGSESNKQPSIHFIFCDDAFLLEINQEFLQHETLTDVITFTLDESDDHLESEIYISLERIEENAQSYHVSFKNELLRVMAHGVLHLVGYTDKDETSKAKMSAQESYWISQLSTTTFQ